MRTTLLIIALLSLCTTVGAQEYNWKVMRPKPKTLDEAIQKLDQFFDDSSKTAFAEQSEREFTGTYHHGLGMWMRNNWGLWRGGALKRQFKELGVQHPDDMSGIIFVTFHRDLKGIPRKVDEQIEYYNEYWRLTKQHFEKMEIDSSYRNRIKHAQDSIENLWWNDHRAEYGIGDTVTVYVEYQCGFMSMGEQTQLQGIIKKWKDREAQLFIIKYMEERHRQKVLNCQALTQGLLWVSENKTRYFRKPE